MDDAALAALGAEPVDWRFKGFPSVFHGRTVADLVAAKPALAEFSTPLMVLDAGALDHNITLMADYCAQRGVDLAPHGKTTMAPQLFARQLAAGAWGVTAATIAHVRVYRRFGVNTVLLGNELIDPDALTWIARELERDAGFRFLCFADSVEVVALMESALRDATPAPAPGTGRLIEVIVDLGLPGGRTGCRDIETAVAVGRSVRDAANLRLVGVGGFEGALAGDRSPAALERIRSYLRFVRETAAALDDLGLFDEAERIVVTAGGSAYFDDVVDALTAPLSLSRPVRPVLRSGAYVTHDDGHYRTLTPFAVADGGAGTTGFRPALNVLGRVISTPEPGLALLDFGKRDAPIDLGPPEPHWLRRAADGERVELTGCSISGLADQHAFLTHGAEMRPAVGDIVACGISHPCTAFDKWQLIPVVEDEHVVDLIRTFF
ncbi:MAG TPA: amino acid deaminase [Actinocrinis sp.]|uniref:amino acid deaminase n=1 Tax=Actinocrinis sp. TaxID=1920516 RepID=UPI002DDD6126|nr:amino acid deaminase [Actinocrinis sp.]HEV3173557.1 amino acid deaminase [Actinocrinis sp.]